ncbi:OmpA family protein [Wielerella bovis]|uniref:OmpA family protein n=1 Tax=Wielerella bovis TaxID=2917790 RepID=UPI002019A7FD|nr:OmpA family protein [Wielerella bovis]ULJ63712.1 OmpA family protein [Wielerella bovis]ULJ64491.1 OmpA family protein [Wielerella bovis]ULJ66111.1 OmpA family protein [Wielerella bovis]ULJ66777.1 OmpA family protein [Wielerella bovis]
MFSHSSPLIKTILLTLGCIALMVVLSRYSLIPTYGLWGIGLIAVAMVFICYRFWIKRYAVSTSHAQWLSLAKGMAQPHYAIMYNEHDDAVTESVLQEDIIAIKIKQIEQISTIINDIHQYQISIGQDYQLAVILDVHPAIETSIGTVVTQLQRQLRYCADIAVGFAVPIVLRFFIPFGSDGQTIQQYSLFARSFTHKDTQSAIRFFETAIENDCSAQLSQIQVAYLAKWLADIWTDIDTQRIRLCGLMVQTESQPIATDSLWSQFCLQTSHLLPQKNKATFHHQDFISSELFLATGKISVSSNSSILLKGIAWILSLAFMSACTFSAYHNYELFKIIHRDVTQFKQTQSTEQKQAAKSALQHHFQTLRGYQMYGLPSHLGLGFFRADFWLPELESALFDEPTVINLDSLSLFDSGSAKLKDNANIPLIKILLEMDKYPDMYILVEGHTDNTGSATLNQTLSEQRALAVRNWLMQFYQLPASRFAVKGYGSSKPLASNDTEEGRAKNRRVSIVLIPKSLLNADNGKN